MSNLVEGMRFHNEVPRGGCLKDRIRLSSGTAPVGGSGRDGQSRYREWAIVPRGPWHVPSADDFAVIATEPTEIGEVQIFRVPPALIKRLRAALGDTKGFGDESHLVRVTASDGCVQALADLENYAKRFGAVTKEPRVRLNRWGLCTTTVDDQQMYTGLHVDNWYRQDLLTRRTSPNRICINVSEEARYLLLINVPQKMMFTILSGNEDEVRLQPGMEGTALGLAFMQTFPDYPVVKLRIEPGEAYLAPTENLVHDGCTEGMTSWDLAVHVLGQFDPGAVAAAASEVTDGAD